MHGNLGKHLELSSMVPRILRSSQLFAPLWTPESWQDSWGDSAQVSHTGVCKSHTLLSLQFPWITLRSAQDEDVRGTVSPPMQNICSLLVFPRKISSGKTASMI